MDGYDGLCSYAGFWELTQSEWKPTEDNTYIIGPDGQYYYLYDNGLLFSLHQYGEEWWTDYYDEEDMDCMRDYYQCYENGYEAQLYSEDDVCDGYEEQYDCWEAYGWNEDESEWDENDSDWYADAWEPIEDDSW